MRPIARKRIDDWRSHLPDLHIPLITDVFAKIPGLGGGAACTTSRSTTATVTDFEGAIKVAKINEIRFQGARRVENLFQYSEDFSNAAWLKLGTGTPVVVTLSGETPPPGISKCYTIDASAAADDRLAQSISGLPTGRYILSFYVRTASGSGTWGYSLNGTMTTVNVDTSWKRVQQYLDFTAGASMNLYIVHRGAGGTVTSAICTGAQLENVTGSSIMTIAGCYVSSNVLPVPYHGAGADGVKYFRYTCANTVSANVVTEIRGGDISFALLRGAIREDSRTNLEWNGGAYTTQASTCAVSAVNPDLMGNQSALFTEDTNTAGHFAYQSAFTGTAGTHYSVSVYVKAGTTSKLQLTTGVLISGVNGYANFDLTNVTVLAQGSAVVSAFIEDVGNGWRRIGITLPAANSGGAPGVVTGTINSDTDTRLPSFLGTSRTFYRSMGQVEVATVTTYSFASTYIPTVGANVTRTNDVIGYSAGVDYTRLNRDFSLTMGFYIDRVVPLADRRTLAFSGNTNQRFQVVAHSNAASPLCGYFLGDGTTPNFVSSGLTAAGQGYIGCIVKRKNHNPYVLSHIGELRFVTANAGADVACTTIEIGGAGSSVFGPVRNIRIWASAQPEDVIRQFARNS